MPATASPTSTACGLTTTSDCRHSTELTNNNPKNHHHLVTGGRVRLQRGCGEAPAASPEAAKKKHCGREVGPKEERAARLYALWGDLRAFANPQLRVAVKSCISS